MPLFRFTTGYRLSGQGAANVLTIQITAAADDCFPLVDCILMCCTGRAHL